MKHTIGVRQSSEYIPIYASLVGMLMIVLASPWDIRYLISIGTWIIVFSALFCIASCLSKIQVSRQTVLFLGIVCLSIVFAMISGGLSYETIVSLVSFAELPCFMLYIGQIHTKFIRRLKQVIYFCFGFMSIFLFFVSFTDVAYQYKHIYGIRNVNDLTLGFNNSNQTGMTLMVIVFILVHAISFFSSRITKTMYALMSVFSINLLFLTNSRSCILLVVMYIIYYLFSFYKHDKLNQYLYKIALVFPFFYLFFSLFLDRKNDAFMILGEPFDTGRIPIFIDFFKNLNFVSIIIGNFHLYPLMNLHNAYVSIFASFGVIVLITYLVFLKKIISNYFKKSRGKNQKLAFLSIILVIFHSSVESAFFVSGSYYAVMFLSLICLLLDDESVNCKVT